jgi:hypothetical protein
VRRSLSALLILLGAFFLVLAILLKFYAGNSVLRTPLDVDSTTHLSGTATLGTAPSFAVRATSITRADSEKSDGKVIVWENSSCVVKDVDNPPNCVSADDPQNRLLSASTDKFATDRNTAMAVSDRKYVSADAGEHKGLVNKFPFQTKKQTYPYWDDTLGKPANAVYKGSVRVGGVETYHFVVDIKDAPAEISEGVQGTYNNKMDIYVEPLTGAILNQTQDSTRVDDSGKPFIALQLGFTDGQIKTSASDAKDNIHLLNLVRITLPIVSLILGLLTLVPGVILWRRSRSQTGT